MAFVAMSTVNDGQMHIQSLEFWKTGNKIYCHPIMTWFAVTMER